MYVYDSMANQERTQINISECKSAVFSVDSSVHCEQSDGSFSTLCCRQRCFHLLKLLLVVSMSGLLYYAWICLTGIAIPCLFHLITGLHCPGCGVTTMFYQILHLEFQQAFAANSFLFVTFPLLLIQGGYAAFKYCKGEPLSRRNNLLLYIYCAALFIFGIIRNLPL